MPHIDTAQALTIFVGNLPTFLAVILAWMHSNGRFGDIHTRMGDLHTRMADLDRSLTRRIDDTAALLRSEFRRVEEVMDARIEHLKQRER